MLQDLASSLRYSVLMLRDSCHLFSGFSFCYMQPSLSSVGAHTPSLFSTESQSRHFVWVYLSFSAGEQGRIFGFSRNRNGIWVHVSRPVESDHLSLSCHIMKSQLSGSLIWEKTVCIYSQNKGLIAKNYSMSTIRQRMLVPEMSQFLQTCFARREFEMSNYFNNSP